MKVAEITSIFEGQTFDWLIESIRAVFKVAFDALAEGSREYSKAKQDFNLVNDAFANLRPLRDRRNFVIHGTWVSCEADFNESDGVHECLADPSPTEGAGVPVFHFRRSRSRRFYAAQRHITVIDIEQLADSLKEEN